MLTPKDPCMSRLRRIHRTFSHYYINVREEFDYYEYILSFYSIIKVNIKGSIGKRKGGLIGLVWRERKIPSSVQQIFR